MTGEWMHSKLDRKRSEKTIFKNLIYYIDCHWDNNLCLKAFAFENHLTSSNLSTIFKKHSGVTITRYIDNKRLEKLKQLKTQTPRVKGFDTAITLGFKSEIQFYRWIKRKTGFTYIDYCKKVGINLLLLFYQYFI